MSLYSKIRAKREREFEELNKHAASANVGRRKGSKATVEAQAFAVLLSCGYNADQLRKDIAVTEGDYRFLRSARPAREAASLVAHRMRVLSEFDRLLASEQLPAILAAAERWREVQVERNKIIHDLHSEHERAKRRAADADDDDDDMEAA
jgi:hypothetical protein